MTMVDTFIIADMCRAAQSPFAVHWFTPNTEYFYSSELLPPAHSSLWGFLTLRVDVQHTLLTYIETQKTVFSLLWLCPANC